MNTADAQALLPSEFRNAAALKAIIAAFTDRVDEWEAGIAEVSVEILLSNAVGVTLDLYGKLVKEYRGDLTDAQYKAIIRGKIRSLRSSGTIPDMRDILRLCLDTPRSNVRLTEGAIAAFRIQAFAGDDATPWVRIFGILDDSRGAGIALQLWYPTGPLAGVFRLSDNDARMTGTAATVGGRLSDNDDRMTGAAETVGDHLAGSL